MRKTNPIQGYIDWLHELRLALDKGNLTREVLWLATRTRIVYDASQSGRYIYGVLRDGVRQGGQIGAIRLESQLSCGLRGTRLAVNHDRQR